MKKLFNQLMPYLNRKYFNGRMIRWMIEDANGRSVSCFCCGNIANGIGEVKLMGWLFRLPVCKQHIVAYRLKHPGGESFTLPGAFPMNLRFSINPLALVEYSMQRVKGEVTHKIVYNLGFYIPPMPSNKTALQLFEDGCELLRKQGQPPLTGYTDEWLKRQRVDPSKN